jgi:hypothetical protein
MGKARQNFSENRRSDSEHFDKLLRGVTTSSIHSILELDPNSRKMGDC